MINLYAAALRQLLAMTRTWNKVLILININRLNEVPARVTKTMTAMSTVQYLVSRDYARAP